MYYKCRSYKYEKPIYVIKQEKHADFKYACYF